MARKKSDDPTRTAAVRKRWIREFNKRFRKLKGDINRMLLKGDPGGIPVPVVNNFVYTSDAQSVARFLLWLNLQVEQQFFSNDATASTIWQNQYIDQAYVRGIQQAKAELRRQGFTPERLRRMSPAEIIGTAQANLGVGLTTSGLIGSQVNPLHLEAIQLLYTREYHALKGITDDMAKEIARVLTQGVEQGLGVRDIASLINDRVDKVGLTRSKLLARTETVRAYNLSNVNEYDAVAQAAGVETLYEWDTAGDERVRSKHAAWDSDASGKYYTKDEILSMVGEPNCRCAVRPKIPDELLED